MNDLYQYFGSDLSASSTGDIAPVDSTIRGQQRILRRLLTNPAEYDVAGNMIAPPDYIWHPEYGAGLPRYVGSVADPQKIRALIRGQILMEDAVAKSPEPVITLQFISGGISVYIKYTDAVTKTAQTLSFQVSK